MNFKQNFFRNLSSKLTLELKLKVETPISLFSVLNFVNKTKVHLFSSWDVWKHEYTSIELYGIDGSMIIPDLNYFGGK